MLERNDFVKNFHTEKNQDFINLVHFAGLCNRAEYYADSINDPLEVPFSL